MLWASWFRATYSDAATSARPQSWRAGLEPNRRGRNQQGPYRITIPILRVRRETVKGLARPRAKGAA